MSGSVHLEELFLAALEKDSAQERSKFLDESCREQPELRGEVERLLAAHGDVGSFLETPPTVVLAAADLITASSATQVDLSFLSPSSRPDSLGRLGNYEILDVVGRGGFGIVLRAFDEKLHRIVAIKTLNPTLAVSATARQRFVREAQAAAAISHENIVHIYAVDEYGAAPYLAMEYVGGLSLEEKLKQDGPLALKEVLRIGLQIAEGLAAAHQHGVVHRDVKPGNILLENGVQRVKISDFGLARAVDDASLTQSGQIAGTPQYMSPEQARGEGIDHRSDLFSLGSVLYAMCAGQPPFQGSTTLGVLKRVCEEVPRALREQNPDLPDWLGEIIARLHAKDPAERFSSAAEVAALLGRCLAHVQQPGLLRTEELLASVPPGATQPRPRRSWVSSRWVVAAAALLCLAAGLGIAETTGTTQLAATVIRIFTPEGTLVIEASDPEVKVTIEGDGGLVIATAGGQQVRLPAGSTYKLRAAKDGKPVPLDRELVTITQGKQQVVRVRLEGASARSAVQSGDVGEFVLPSGKGIAERHYNTLAEAIKGASAGDTIEIHGNGPFVAMPLVIERPLTIRAAAGFHPVFEMTVAQTPATDAAPMLMSRHALTLEGLEFRLNARFIPANKTGILVCHQDLSLANCRFVLLGQSAAVHSYSIRCTVRNCQFVAAPGTGAPWCLKWDPGVDGQLQVEHCLFALNNGAALTITARRGIAGARVTRNTFVGGTSLSVHIPEASKPASPASVDAPLRVKFDACGNVFGSNILSSSRPGRYDMSAQEAGDWLRRCVKWREDTNVYSSLQRPLRYFIKTPRGYSSTPIEHVSSLAEWETYWGVTGTSAAVGPIRFATGDTHAQAQADTWSLTPEDFRLREGSPGYRAGPDGQDLGAAIDLVGPGSAYERWKRTSAYPQWLKDTGQVE